MCLDLTRYQDRIVIGTAGDIVLTGPQIMPRHAELAPASNGSGPGAVVLRALDGEVWMERGPVLTLVTGDHVLLDGDVVVIASYRLRYRNMGTRPTAGATMKGVPAWLK